MWELNWRASQHGSTLCPIQFFPCASFIYSIQSNLGDMLHLVLTLCLGSDINQKRINGKITNSVSVCNFSPSLNILSYFIYILPRECLVCLRYYTGVFTNMNSFNLIEPYDVGTTTILQEKKLNTKSRAKEQTCLDFESNQSGSRSLRWCLTLRCHL